MSLLVGLLLGAVGAVIGTLFVVGTIPGAIIGAILGVVIAEYHRREDWNEALKTGGGWAAGCLISGAVQLIISIIMILIFVWQALRG